MKFQQVNVSKKIMLCLVFIILGLMSASITQAAPNAYIANSASNSVSVIDTATNNVIATVDVGSHPYGVAVSPDGTKAYVTNEDSYIVSVIDTGTNNVIAAVDVGSHPSGVAVSPDGIKAYIANKGSNNVSIIDTATNNVIATVDVGNLPHCVVVSPDGQKVYVVDYGDNAVSVISTATNKVIKTVYVGSYPIGVAITPDGAKVYVADGVNPYTLGFVSVIDTATDTVVATVPVEKTPENVAVSPDGERVYVTNCDSSTISVIDTETDTIIAKITGFNYPMGVSFTPDGKKLYVVNYGPYGNRNLGTVSIVDTSTNTIIATVAVGINPGSFGQFIVPAPALAKVTPTITWNNPADIAYGTPLGDAQLNAETSVPGTFTYTLEDGTLIVSGITVLSAGVHTLHVDFTPTDTANYNTASKDVQISIIVPALTISPIIVPLDPVPVGTSITTSADVTYLGDLNALTVEWNWGDGSTSQSPVSSSKVEASHVYNSAGIYTVSLTVKDATGGSVKQTATDYIVVYDPNGGFVTGGGWINSPAGAYVANTNLEGKATFGFVSKYQKGATVPTGKTEFQFKVADLNFHSESYDWLVVAGSQAKYKGTGTINGEGNYGFMLSAVDGAVDKFRIKIWDKESENIIYDNEIGTEEDSEPSTAINGGSIIIHKEK